MYTIINGDTEQYHKTDCWTHIVLLQGAACYTRLIVECLNVYVHQLMHLFISPREH